MSNPKSISRKISAPIGRALLLLACMLATVASSAPAYAAEPVKIGVLAYRSKPQTLAQWQPLAAALKQAIPERDFTIEVLTLNELEMAVASRQLDFVLTNPSQYVLLSRRSGLSSPLATLAEDEEGHALSVYGGVIFCRAGQTVFNTLNSLRGKTIAMVGTDSLGGYQMQAYELIRAGVRLPQDASLLITGMPHDNVVEAVLAGRADIGFVRTGVLEDMVREGKLEMAQLRIINRQDLPGYSAALSTHLYPNWPFAALPHIDENLSRHVTAALFRLEESAAATRAIRIHGFVVPADYSPLEDLLRELRLPPFDVAPEFTLQDVWKQYRWWITAALIAIAAILLLGYRLGLSNHSLRAGRRMVLQQQQQLQESEYRWKFAIEGSGGGLWDWNVTNSAIFFTKRWKEMFGFAENEISSDVDEWKKRIHSGDAAGALAKLQDCLNAKTPTYVSEHRILCKDGSYKWILDRGMVVSRSEDGKPLRLIGTVYDITERKQAEAALFQLNAELERRVAQRTAELDIVIYDLENFNYSASHDLRIPLRAIDGFSRILLDEHSQQLNAEGVRLLKVVRANTRKMAQYIEDMQAFTTIGRMAVRPAEINMDALAHEVVEELMSATAGREIKLEIKSLPPIIADRPMMRWVMVNLLGNAIKFTRHKAAAQIEVGAKTENKETVFYVKDNGVGFNMQYAGKLFGVFQRLHGVEEFEGTGIGLAIVKRIITRHGGLVWAEGKLNNGATFYFSIPFADTTHAKNGGKR